MFTVSDICSLFQIYVHYFRYFFLDIYIFNCFASLFHCLQGCFSVVNHYFYCSAMFFSISYIFDCFASLLHHLSIFSLFCITIFTVLHDFPSLQIIFQLYIIIKLSHSFTVYKVTSPSEFPTLFTRRNLWRWWFLLLQRLSHGLGDYFTV